MVRWVLIAGALVLGGCGEPRSQTFAITLRDSPTVECTGFADGLLADPSELEELAKDMRKAYKEAKLADPPELRGLVLRVNELETTTAAWFEGPADNATTTVPPYFDEEPGEPPRIDSTIPAAASYVAPGVVYEGEPQDDYFEGTYRQVFNTDEQDDETGLRLCGERARARGTLTITTTDGVAGRIRWIETEYVPSRLCACEGRIECARDVTIEGLAVE